MKANTYLHFNGNCKEVMTFYADVLGGKITVLMQFKDAPEEVCKSFPEEVMGLTMHCTLEAGDMVIQASDYLDPNQALITGTNFAISLNSNIENEIITIFNRLAEGGMVMMPLEDAFWGGKFGMLKDKYGIRWMLTLDQSKS